MSLVISNQLACADLFFCLQALGHAPAGVVKGRAQDWVPLCLSYLSANGSPSQWESADSQPADADAQADVTQQAESPSEAALAEAGDECRQEQVLRIGARCAAPAAARAQGTFCRLASFCTLQVHVPHQPHIEGLHACMCPWSDNFDSSAMAGKSTQITSIMHACAPEDCGGVWQETGSLCWQT